MRPAASRRKPTASGRRPSVTARRPTATHQPVELESLVLALVPAGDAHAARRDFARRDHGAEPDVEPLGGKGGPRGGCYFPVRGDEKVVERFEQRDLGAEAPPHAAELEPDHARPDDTEAPRHLGERERPFVVDDALAVGPRHRQLDGSRAGRHDDVSRRERLDLSASGRGNHHLASGTERAFTLEPLNPVLSEQARDAAGQRAHHLVLSRLHRGHVDSRVLHADSMSG